MTPKRPRTPTPHTIRARSEAICVFAAKHGWTGDTAMAKAFGVSRKTAWRVLHSTRSPSPQFIAGVLASSTDAVFEELFEIVPDAKGLPDAVS